MIHRDIYSSDVAGAREEILSHIKVNPIGDNISIYYDGWNGFGAATVLRSIAQVLPTMKSPRPELSFGRTIYIDCSSWTNKRAMQKKIALELSLDHKTMAMFEKEDEDDDFNGVDLGSRDAIRSMAVVIDRILRESRFMMIFINGSQDEIVLSQLGIPVNWDCVILWTFSRRLVTMSDYDGSIKVANKLRYTDIFIQGYNVKHFSSPKFIALLYEDAADIVSRYPSHAPNCWICDGIIQGDKAWEISNALNQEISFDCDASVLDVVFKELKKDQKIFFLVSKDDHDDVYGKRPYYRWISITLKNKNVPEDITNIVGRASSIFLAFETQDVPHGLPNGLFKQCSNLGVLVLSGCAFSFVSPPFLHCHTLRFLGLDHCRDNNATELERGDCTTKLPFLKSLWVIDLYYTDWVELLSEENIDLVGVNIEGVRWRRWMTDQLHKRLPYLRQLRIIGPMYDEAETTPSGIIDSFHMVNTSLETLDLSGCNGLEDVVVSNNSSLRSFSLDGYGPTSPSHRTSTVELPPMMSRPEQPSTDADKKKVIVRTSMVSLAGCTQLDKLFLRGLPNLVELDLSGCAIKVLDFGAMVVDVPGLKRLFLLGCEHLHAIKWGSESDVQEPKLLELICIDTRPGSDRVAPRCSCRAPSLGAQQNSSELQVHAAITDARFARSLYAPIRRKSLQDLPYYFNIRITSSAACTAGDVVVQHVATARQCKLYGDVFAKVGDGLAPMQAFPQAPTGQSNCHIEIDDGSRNVQSEVEAGANIYNLAYLVNFCAQSLHVHDVSTCSRTISGDDILSLTWCRVERCPKLQTVFPPGAEDSNGTLETIWVSDLLMAHCVWSNKGRVDHFDNIHLESLRHLHLRRCPSLRFALAMGSRPSFPSLETLHIIHCGDLRNVFVPGNEEYQHTSVEFPKLINIHLHDLSSLQQICEAAEMLAPALETIRIRGCPNLRRLPALKGRKQLGMMRPTVEVEKDVWDALKWDGMDAGHHPSLYEAPVHSRNYKRRILRRTVLR